MIIRESIINERKKEKDIHMLIVNEFISALNNINLNYEIDDIELHDEIIYITLYINNKHVEIDLVYDVLGWRGYIKAYGDDIYLGELPEWDEYKFSYRIKQYLNKQQ